MATKRRTDTPTRAGRSGSDREVRSADHDEVLKSLIRHLPGVCANLLAPTDEWSEAATAEARANWKRDRLRAGLAKDSFRQPPADLFAPALSTYEVMRAVELEPRRGLARASGYGRRPPMGFVDLAAVVKRVTSVFLNCKENDADPLGGSGSGEREAGEGRTAGAAAHGEWMQLMEPVTLWFTVRAGAFTLGEVLQELKTLKTLEGQEQAVVLCVAQLAPELREVIEHEGFDVVCMDEYERVTR